MNLNQKILCEETVFVQEIDDEMVLLDMKSENYFGLDEVGASMWKVFQNTESLKEALNVLGDEYDVSREVLENDIENFVSQLEKSGLIKLEQL